MGFAQPANAAPTPAPTPTPPRRAGAARRARNGRIAGFAGRAAEDSTLRGYLRDGGRLMHRNWRADRAHGGGEVDLIVEQDGVIVFVEVKARRTIEDAARAIRPAQWRRISAAAEHFLAQGDFAGRDIRFDVALCDRQGRLETIENAYWQ